jgi:hypothetical protein
MLAQDNPSVQTVEAFLESLLQKLGAGERTEVRHQLPGDDNPMHQEFFATTKETARRAVYLGKARNVYVGAAIRRGEDGTKKGVCRIPALWGDLDAKGEHSRESRLYQLLDLPYHPSILVWTGGGWHAYWLLKRPAEGSEELERAEHVMRHLALGLDGDPVHDRSRIMRLPGSYNFKHGAPRLVKIEHFDPDRRHELEELRQMAESLPGGCDDDSTGAKVPHEVLSEPIREHRRNLSLTSVAGSLRDRGLDAETICVVLTEVNRVRCLPPLEDDEVLSIARSISRYSVGKPRYKRSPVKRIHKNKER